MKPITNVKEIQKIELEILEKIHDFCVKNKIRYSLCGGTLLGAVRHKGFIPWDDDVDVFMPRPDYDKFCRTFSADGVSLHDHENDANYLYPFAKIYDTRTLLIEKSFPQIAAGIYVDIFPVDGFRNERAANLAHKSKIFWFRFVSLRQLPLFKKGRALYKTAILLTLRTFLWAFPNRFFNRRIRGAMMKHDFENSPIAACQTWGYGMKECCPREAFSDFVDVDFEGKKFKAFSGWKIYLTNLYGDFMTPPPPEKQISNHSFNAWWK